MILDPVLGIPTSCNAQSLHEVTRSCRFARLYLSVVCTQPCMLEVPFTHNVHRAGLGGAIQAGAPSFYSKVQCSTLKVLYQQHCEM